MKFRDYVIDSVPNEIIVQDWLDYIDVLSSIFKQELYRININIGLRSQEIDFAVNGFSSVCSAVGFAVIRSKLTDFQLSKISIVNG